LDWDCIFAQLKRFYRCSKAEFKDMTLHEVFQLMEDGEKLINIESGEKKPGSTLSIEDKKNLIKRAKERRIKLPRKGF